METGIWMCSFSALSLKFPASGDAAQCLQWGTRSGFHHILVAALHPQRVL